MTVVKKTLKNELTDVSAAAGNRNDSRINSSMTSAGPEALKCKKRKLPDCDKSKAVTSHTNVDGGTYCMLVMTYCMLVMTYFVSLWSLLTQISLRGRLYFDVAGGSTVVDGSNARQLSPSSALRAAYLKSRYAETIVKMRHRAILSKCVKGGYSKMQQVREKFEKELPREKARLEAEFKAAEAAELKVQREMEAAARRRVEEQREAARLALQKMVQTVYINENDCVMKGLKDLGYVRSKDEPGVFIKVDDLDEEPQVGNVNNLE